MTYESAFSSIVDGGTNTNAMKRTSWGGYIFRTDTPLSTITVDWEGGKTGGYTVGDIVRKDQGTSPETYRYYVCYVAEPGTSSITFVSDHWKELTERAGFTITYRERSDDSGSGSAPFIPGWDGAKDYVATFVPCVTGTSITYRCSLAPQATVSGSVKYLELDAQLQDSILASDWNTGKAEDFESARSGGTDKRW